MHFVYLLQSKRNDRVYIGYTTDIRRRVAEHNSGEERFTKRDVPWVLIYCEIYRKKSDAKRRERRLKYHGSAKYQLLERLKDSLLEPKTEEG